MQTYEVGAKQLHHQAVDFENSSRPRIRASGKYWLVINHQSG